MAIKYDWKSPIITTKNLPKIKTELETAFGKSFDELKELFQFLIKYDENGYYFEDEDGNRFEFGDGSVSLKDIIERLDALDGGEKGGGADKGLEARVKALEDMLERATTLLEQYIGGDEDYLKRIYSEYLVDGE